MNLTLLAFGTRGDVQPMLALAQGLRAAGHAVTVAAGSNFQSWVESHGMRYAPISADIEAMMRSPQGVRWVEGGRLREPLHMRALFRQVAQPAALDMLAASEGAEIVIGGFTSDWAGGAIAEKLGSRYVSALLQPSRPTRAGSATLLPLVPRGNSALNAWMGRLALRTLFTVFGDDVRAFRAKLGLKPLDRTAYSELISRTPVLHGFSTHVVPRPADYLPHWHVTGYWFHEDENWQPPEALQRFLVAGPTPVYIGFGSMTDSDARATTDLIIHAQRDAGVRVVLYGGWAGLSPQSLPQDVFMLLAAPHGWLFPRMRAIVHHGGAGTTAAVRAGVPQFIAPHFADQPFWARRVHELGVAAKPVSKHKLTVAALSAALLQTTTDALMLANAAALGRAVRAENGVGAAVQLIEGLFS
jgi:sterol 3beta-glucosyltransferase